MHRWDCDSLQIYTCHGIAQIWLWWRMSGSQRIRRNLNPGRSAQWARSDGSVYSIDPWCQWRWNAEGCTQKTEEWFRIPWGSALERGHWSQHHGCPHWVSWAQLCLVSCWAHQRYHRNCPSCGSMISWHCHMLYPRRWSANLVSRRSVFLWVSCPWNSCPHLPPLLSSILCSLPQALFYSCWNRAIFCFWVQPHSIDRVNWALTHWITNYAHSSAHSPPHSSDWMADNWSYVVWINLCSEWLLWILD